MIAGVMRRFSVAVLTVWLVLLSSLVYPQLIAHTCHHAQHSASTHATALCTWMCAVGQMLDAVQVVPQTRFDPVVFEFAFDLSTPFSTPVESQTSRGPPVLSL